MKRDGGRVKINVLAVASHGHRRSCSDTQRHRENATGGYRRWWLIQKVETRSYCPV
jgi:hypothetical protein